MCGINGLIGIEGFLPDENDVRKMNMCLAHRGPDNDGIYNGRTVIFGHRRLSILDLSEAGNQPFFSPDKRYVLVYNGEIYNFKSLREELKDEFDFTTGTDTEVILAAWQKWGLGFLDRFNGMFAFAIHDTETGETLLVRDRMGIKPLYYSITDDVIIFSSEMRSMLASGKVKRRISPEGLVDYLRYQTVHAPNTIVNGVRMLMPGHFMKINSQGEVEIKQYWDLTETDPEVRSYTKTKIKKDIKDKFFQSVEKRMVSDVPFGAFLSGGIDSSAVVGAMSEVSSGKINTFCVTFEEDHFSEATYARHIADKFNTIHRPIHLRPKDFLDLLPEALRSMDHPSGDGPNTYVVSKVTREAGITMALSGLGGDELFAGYDIFKLSGELEAKKWLQGYPKFLKKMGGTLLRNLRPGVASSKIAELLLLDYFELAYTYPLSRQVLLDRDIVRLLHTETLPPNKVFNTAQNLIAYGTKGFDLPFLSKVSVLEISTYMQNVLLRDTDQMSMAHSLEVRVPFLDHELVRYVLSVPDKYKYPHTPKQLLIESLGDLLPEEIVNRKKMGFTFPWEHWMKGELKQFVEERINRFGSRGIIHDRVIQNMYQRFLKGDPRVTWSRIWPLVVLENWLEENKIES